MVETLAGVLLFLVLCYLGNLFGRLVFVYAIERTTTQLCFVSIFALSTFIFIVGLLDASKMGSLYFSMGFCTHALRLAIVADIVIISVLCPLGILWSFLRSLRLRHFLPLLVGCSLLVVVFGVRAPLLVLVRRLPGFGVQGDVARISWDAATTGVALLGVLAVGVLSGYAAVTTPAAFIRPLVVKGSGEGARAALGVLAKRQRHLLSLWISKQRHIAEAWGAAAPSVGGGKPRVWNWVTKSLRSTVGGGGLRRGGDDVAKLKAECNGIQAVSMAVFLEMSEMDSLVRSAESGATWRGWADALLGVLLLFHTVLKLVFTIISLLRWGMSSADNPTASPLPEDTATRVVNFLETYGLATPHSEGAEQRIVWVSLVLNAWMIMCSIRGFLLTVFRLVMTYTTFLSVDTTVLGLTAGMGAYFVGQMLLLHLSPQLESQSVLFVVRQEQLPMNEMYRHLNDLVFVISSIITVFVVQCFGSPTTAMQFTVAD
ncbi:hypothetical protein DQ04_13381010 [Trypanosoma grayi]|uniref:hypothetical protein n=1 Tax=Trypanosoma grayi TaxID=71804 RepID=UPI0004F40D36|nr:hypothetical protein DQ04_13381010 [Trypanosoma grayi]KEG06551.1 hypothetical protein DQ04_13381010 [Trypanosoma grayi]